VNFHQPEFSKAIPVTQQKIKLLLPVEALQAQVVLQVLLLQVLLVLNPPLLPPHQLVLNPPLLPLLPLLLLQNLQLNQQPSQQVNRS
jgi:hypothetical protein